MRRLYSSMLGATLALGVVATSNIALAPNEVQAPSQPAAASPSVSSHSRSESGNTSTLTRWAKSLSFAFPAGGSGYLAGSSYLGGVAGMWLMVLDDLNAGLNLGITTHPSATEGDDWQIVLAPAVKYYFTKGFNVAPFVFGQFDLTFGKMSALPGTKTSAQVGLAGGLGAEYFVMKQLSLGGQVGVRFDANRPSPLDVVGFVTFTSSLNLSFYFD